MNKIGGIFIVMLLIYTTFPASGMLYEVHDQLTELPNPVFPNGEVRFNPRGHHADRTSEYEYITRDKIIDIAEAYATYEWYPTMDNIFHGACPETGERVDTTDRDYYTSWYDFWGWKADQLNIGVPYKIGGFSSISGFNLTNPEDFYEQYTGTGACEGTIHFGGDTYTAKSEPCPRACGVDCSGFISRCWNLPEKHYTFSEPGFNGLPDVSSPIRYHELQPGDLLDWSHYPIGHAILFKEFVDANTLIVIEQGGVACQVVEHACNVTFISDDGFSIRLEGSYYTYTTDYENKLFETRRYNFISNTPTTPTIEGPTSGNKNIEYVYSFVATDPNGDDIYYHIEWGDNKEKVGPHPSSEIVTVNHTWSEEGIYYLRAKAKDTNGLESGWSMMSITMPKNKPSYSSSFHRFLEQYPHLTPLLRLLLHI